MSSRVRQAAASPAMLMAGAALLVAAAFAQADNHERPAFRNNVALKKAINLAIDRSALLRSGGHLFGKRVDQILPPLLGRDESIYP